LNFEFRDLAGPVMKIFFTLFAVSCLAASVRADEPKTPVPPELQALAESLVNALKAPDDAALAACWHSPEVLAKRKEAEAQAQAATAATEINVSKERDKEQRRREKDMAVTQHRVGQIRALITKNFGDLAQLKLEELELDLDDDAPETDSVYEDVELHLVAADGTKLRFEVDDAVRVDGVWKFMGRLEDKLSIELTEP